MLFHTFTGTLKVAVSNVNSGGFFFLKVLDCFSEGSKITYCSANQRTGFYMRGTLDMKELKC